MLDHQRDLWADFRVFYHLSPTEALALPGPEYLALAYRTPVYQGVIAARIERDRRRAEVLGDEREPVAELDALKNDEKLGAFID